MVFPANILMRNKFWHPCFLNSILAEQFRSIFSSFPYFNFVQSKVLDDASILLV